MVTNTLINRELYSDFNLLPVPHVYIEEYGC
jgi:hypothetical protein